MCLLIRQIFDLCAPKPGQGEPQHIEMGPAGDGDAPNEAPNPAGTEMVGSGPAGNGNLKQHKSAEYDDPMSMFCEPSQYMDKWYVGNSANPANGNEVQLGCVRFVSVHMLTNKVLRVYAYACIH